MSTRVLEVPVLVDSMQNEAWEALGSWPNMAVLLGTDGHCRFYQGWLDPNELQHQLTEQLLVSS